LRLFKALAKELPISTRWRPGAGIHEVLEDDDADAMFTGQYGSKEIWEG
jgi:hypothetical protein